MNLRSRRGWMVGEVVFLLLLFALEVITTVRQESLTWDEGDHIFAGYMSWKTHDYGLNPEPPARKAAGDNSAAPFASARATGSAPLL